MKVIPNVGQQPPQGGLKRGLYNYHKELNKSIEKEIFQEGKLDNSLNPEDELFEESAMMMPEETSTVSEDSE